MKRLIVLVALATAMAADTREDHFQTAVAFDMRWFIYFRKLAGCPPAYDRQATIDLSQCNPKYGEDDLKLREQARDYAVEIFGEL